MNYISRRMWCCSRLNSIVNCLLFGSVLNFVLFCCCCHQLSFNILQWLIVFRPETAKEKSLCISIIFSLPCMFYFYNSNARWLFPRAPLLLHSCPSFPTCTPFPFCFHRAPVALHRQWRGRPGLLWYLTVILPIGLRKKQKKSQQIAARITLG